MGETDDFAPVFGASAVGDGMPYGGRQRMARAMVQPSRFFLLWRMAIVEHRGGEHIAVAQRLDQPQRARLIEGGISADAGTFRVAGRCT